MFGAADSAAEAEGPAEVGPGWGWGRGSGTASFVFAFATAGRKMGLDVQSTVTYDLLYNSCPLHAPSVGSGPVTGSDVETSEGGERRRV